MHPRGTDFFLLKNSSRSRRRARKSPRTHAPPIARFRSTVWRYWKKNGRHELPWRKTADPYKILVSEVMLQQTQVSRVMDKYETFLARFPTVRALAKAPLSGVVKEWSGLGYNRRAKYLHDTAKVVVAEHEGDIRRALAHPLPGVGPYTRAAVRTFAFNEPATFIETNIRTALIHHFFSRVVSLSTHGREKIGTMRKVADAEILPVAERAAKGQDPRTWHSALMDYGAHLKRSGVRKNSRFSHYVKQSKFEGSLRQTRGAILRALHDGSRSSTALYVLIRANKKVRKTNFRKAVAGLAQDGLIAERRGAWRLA